MIEKIWATAPDLNQYNIPKEVREFYECLVREFRGEYDADSPNEYRLYPPPVPDIEVLFPMPGGRWKDWIFVCMDCGAFYPPEMLGEQWSVRACPCGSRKYYFYFTAWGKYFEESFGRKRGV